MTLEDLQNQRAALVAARGKGLSEVEFHSGGTRRRVVYPSIADLQAAIDAVDRDIASIQGTRVRTFRFNTSKGL
jgi:hypothetical protein